MTKHWMYSVPLVGLVLATAACGASRPVPVATAGVEPVTPSRQAWVPCDELEVSFGATAERHAQRDEESSLRPMLVTAKKAHQ